MSHSFEFVDFGAISEIISRQEVRDLIDLFYEGPDSKITVKGDLKSKNTRGRCKNWTDTEFEIQLNLDVIKDHFKKGLRMGGNKPHKTLKEAICSVIAHETQHANQCLKHRNNKSFWSGKYMSRPCEVNARIFADQNHYVIESILSNKINVIEKSYREESLNDILEIFSELESVSHFDIREELRAMGINNPVNLNWLSDNLQKKGVVVKS